MSINIMSQRALQTSLRRFATSRPAAFRALSPYAIATGQIRLAATHASSNNVSSSDAQELLAAQRRFRPVAPHITIYKPQITWILSGLNRITGVILSGAFYLFGLAYLAAPAFGWHLESASVAAAFASLPIAIKVFTKFFFAWPFAFHSWNGIRHLVQDTGAAFANPTVIWTGWFVVGLSTLTAGFLTFY